MSKNSTNGCEAVVAAAASEPTAPRPLVLVADDTEDIRELVALHLRREGYSVVLAADGLEALRLGREAEPDLVLLDVSMPGRSGMAVCREMQSWGPSTPPIIFLTAKGETSARVAGLDAGAVDYVVKPFARAELLARVRAGLRTKAMRDVLALEAVTDPLTGLVNRRQLDARALEAVATARRGHPLACLMIDLDGFKAINDMYGHGAGDRVLAEVARRLRQVTRDSDVLGRYGGDEFLLLLEGDASGVAASGERIRQLFAREPVKLPGPDAACTVPIRASVGVACWSARIDDVGALYATADRALYRAKRLGGDCVVVDCGGASLELVRGGDR